MQSKEQVVSQPWYQKSILALLILPAIIFYAILLKNISGLPIGDGYHAILNFANHWAKLDGICARLQYLLQFQHNEYKLIFESTLVALQYSATGHINFYVLSMAGNAFVIGVFFVLAAMYRRTRLSQETQTWTGLVYLVPFPSFCFSFNTLQLSTGQWPGFRI